MFSNPKIRQIDITNQTATVPEFLNFIKFKIENADSFELTTQEQNKFSKILANNIKSAHRFDSGQNFFKAMFLSYIQFREKQKNPIKITVMEDIEVIRDNILIPIYKQFAETITKASKDIHTYNDKDFENQELLKKISKKIIDTYALHSGLEQSNIQKMNDMQILEAINNPKKREEIIKEAKKAEQERREQLEKQQQEQAKELDTGAEKIKKELYQLFAVENLDENSADYLTELKQAIDNFIGRYKTMDAQKQQNLNISRGYDIVQNIFENTPDADDAENKDAKNKKKQYNNELLQKLYSANYQLQETPRNMQRTLDAFNELIEKFKPKEETKKTLELDPSNTDVLKIV